MITSFDHAGATDGVHALLPLTDVAWPETAVRAGETLVAPAFLLSAESRAIASCAGLTYVRPVRVVEYTEAGTELWLCQVAAQVHYLDQRGYAFTALFDSVLLASATRYESRRHGSMATVDVRDLVEDAFTDGLYAQQQQLSLPISARDVVLALAPLADHIDRVRTPVPAPVAEQEKESSPVASLVGRDVVVPISVLREVGEEAFRRAKECRRRCPALPVLLLRAVEEVLQRKRDLAAMTRLDWEVSTLSRNIAQVRALLQTWRRSWTSVDVIAQYERGKYGVLEACRMSLHLPTEQAA